MYDGTDGSANSIDSEAPPEGGTRARSRALVAALVVVLVLLLTFCTVLGSLSQFRTEKVRFIARNAECLSCHPEKIAQMRLASPHQPFITKHCTSCHIRHGRNVRAEQSTVTHFFSNWLSRVVRWGPFEWLLGILSGKAEGSEVTSSTTTTRGGKLGPGGLKAPVSELCWSCHPGVSKDLQLEVQHVPFAKANCTSCHDPHASDIKPLLIGTEDLVCGQCHPMGDLARTFLHPPAEQWQCRSCHRAHGSNYDGMLHLAQKDLCFSCHPRVAADENRKVVHNPFVNDNCTGCHEPHGAPAEPMLAAQQPQLCYRCHTAIQKDFARASHHPVGTKMNCSDCHFPHSGEWETLLRASSRRICFLCHPRYENQLAVSRHGVLKCVSCHGAHGTNTEPLLKKKNPTLCLNCHEARGHRVGARFYEPNTHPATPEYWDKFANAPLTCTSTCHNPHGTPYDYMLSVYPWYRDGLCLQCHSRVGKDF